MASTAAASTVDSHSAADPSLDRLEPELASVLSGLKPAGRHSASASLAAVLAPGLERLGLRTAFHVPADQRAGIAYLSPAEQARLLALPRGHLLYAHDGDVVAALVAAHEGNDNEAIGDLLGYPRCCVEANWIYDTLPYNDYVRVARVSAEFDWRLNVFVSALHDRRGRQLQLVSHFPCALGCKASIGQAKARLTLLDERMPELSAATRAAARLPVLLHDDSRAAPAERTGLCGWALRGIVADGELLFSRAIPLRDVARAPMGLPAAGRIRGVDGDLIVDCMGEERRTLCLGSSQWILLLPS